MILSDISIKRPVFATMMIMILLVFGIISYPRLGVDLYPNVDFPIVTVTTTLEGASPEVMETDVTDVIEEAVNTIDGIRTITSMSAEGYSRVTIEFELDRNINIAAQDVRDKIAAAKRLLPKDIDPPIIEKLDITGTPIMWIGVYGDRNIKDITFFAEKVLKRRLERLPGVGSIIVGGKREREIRIWLDADKLEAYKLTASDVTSAIKSQHIEVPGGRLESVAKEFVVKTKGEFEKVSDFNNLIIAYRDGSPIRLKNVGYAEDGMEDKRRIVYLNGRLAVGLGIRRLSGANTVAVAESVKEELRKSEAILPSGIKLDIGYDASQFIKESIKEVQFHLIFGSIMVILVVSLFLRSLKSTIISAIALPTSIIATFTFMNALKFTLNNMTMLALSLSVGMLIDDAIVVLENIFRHQENGENPIKAAQLGTKEIGLAVMATTFSIVAVFIPVAFMSGIVGRFFYEFGVTVSVAVLVSLFVSFTLTPMLCSRFLRIDTKHGKLYSYIGNVLSLIDEIYRKLLAISLKNRWKVIGIAIIIFAFSLNLWRYLGKEFTPPEDKGRFLVRMETPIGTSVDRSDKIFKEAERIVSQLPEVRTVFYALGFGGAEGDVTKGVLFIHLKNKRNRKRSQQEIMNYLRKKFKSIPDLTALVEEPSMLGSGTRNAPVQLVIQGRDMKGLIKYSNMIMKELKKIPGVVDVDSDLENIKPEVRVYIDRERAGDLNLDVVSIASAINTLIGGIELGTTKFKDIKEGERYDIRVRLLPKDRITPEDIGKLLIRSKDGKLIRLKNVIVTEEGVGPNIINRKDRERSVTIFANLYKKPLGEVVDELNKITKRTLPREYTTSYRGLGDEMKRAFKALFFALVLGIIIRYMIFASQFESFIHPFTIMLSIPLSLIGAFGALYITGNTINIFSMIGILMLMGLVEKNAILLVDYTNTLRNRGFGRDEAVLKAGPVRLRPILMTTFSMVFGMLPIAIGIGIGSETRSPMAIAVIGGLLTSLFLTLIVVPVVYTLLDDLFKKK
jgi:HAE1 family hydrophobic/amphiphilic exporter-1